MSLPLHYQSAKSLAGLVRRRKIGALELLDHFLGRVERYNPRINAVIWESADAARKRARALDRATAKGARLGPLHGVPMTIKESYDVVGMPTTRGMPALKNNFPPRNALTVDRLNAAGVNLFGKTNVPLSLADWQSYNEIYGTTNNPWDVTRSPGGSSGGSAAALAAGLCGIEAGSDIGASIRNPAHYCGVYGLKPTFGIVPVRGQAMPGVLAPGDITVIGPMARSAEDLAIGLDVMAGPDDIDAAGWQLRLKRPTQTRLRDFRVAVMLDDPNAEVDQEVQTLLTRLADFLGRQKVKVSHIARPEIDTGEAQRVYVTLLRAATSGRQTPEQFQHNVEVARRLDPADESYFARMTRANVLAHKDWLAVNETRHRMRHAWAAFFREWDLLLCPAASSAAFPHDHQGERHERLITVNNKRVPTTDQLFWAGFSGAFYLPSVVAPAGLTPTGLPVGVQIVGPQFGDLACIRFAELLEREYQAFTPPPGYD
ncbi:amidase [Desertibaculum subflavum]|uniref:amidase n=1 Tax=Desertibaculum subflavum TaxID=2268458 RepID=UPI000E6691F6